MKMFLTLQMVFTFCSAMAFAGASMDKPVVPTQNCNSYNQQTAFQGYMTCIMNFNNQVVNYQNQVNQYNQNVHASGATPISGASGLIIQPVHPTNNCGAAPAVSDTSAWSTHNSCVSQYNSNRTYYHNAMNAYNVITDQFMAQQKAAQDAEEKRLAEIRPENQTTTGTLQQVQMNNQSASKTYAVAGAILAGYGAYQLAQSEMFGLQCGSQNYGACVAAGVAAVMAYNFFGESNKANNQVKSFGQNAVSVCQAQNALQTTQQNCNNKDPSSPFYEATLDTPPNENWYDPTTGQCKSDAPQVCKDMMAGNEGYKPMGNSLPKITDGCPGGGTSCLTGINPLMVQTAKGLKVTIKDKNGKEISMYPADYRDEKSMLAAGMSPAMAKKLLNELNLSEENTKKALADAKKAGEGLEGLDSNSVVGSGSFGGSSAIVGDLESEEAKKRRRFKDDLAAAEAKRKPSSAGLSKNFHGDLIGSSGDDIFSMMNRRYQLKSEQDTFFTP